MEFDHVMFLIVLLLIQSNRAEAQHDNRPSFGSSPTWKENATTVLNESIIGIQPRGIFININDHLFVTTYSGGNITVWNIRTNSLLKRFSTGANITFGIFATLNDDIYVDSVATSLSIAKWPTNNSNVTHFKHLTDSCYSIFIDTNETLYCSVHNLHTVKKVSLTDSSFNWTCAAGDGTSGNSRQQLHNPQGIFVHINFTLYIADCSNNRIQIFERGNLNGNPMNIVVLPLNTSLNCPTSVVLDGDNNMYIVDLNNHRVVGSRQMQFYCVAGCTGNLGSAANQLQSPQAMSFDSYGSIYVLDKDNNRVQRFDLNIPLPTRTSLVSTLSTEFLTSTMMTSSALITNSISASVTISQSQLGISNCSIPTILLTPNTPNLGNPASYRRSDELYIDSYLQFNCNYSFPMQMRWIIYICTSMCSEQMTLDPNIIVTDSDLVIPERTLLVGVYRIELTTMTTTKPSVTTSTSIFVKINPSSIKVNLLPFGTSMVTHSYNQDLLLNPGAYTIDPDASSFNTSNWNYRYYCRIYGLHDFPNNGSARYTIDDPNIDPNNPSCLSNITGIIKGWTFVGKSNVIESALMITAGYLLPNHTYQFMVEMINQNNRSLRTNGFVLVKIESSQIPMILQKCVIPMMCIWNGEYQIINPTAQVVLSSSCFGSCSSIQKIQWNVYQGVRNVSVDVTQWTSIPQVNLLLFGFNTNHLTIPNTILQTYPLIKHWRFEVVYTFIHGDSASALDFVTNNPPSNGFCSVSPLNGTMTTVFTISCSNWSATDSIKDYSLFGWRNSSLKRTFIGYSVESEFHVRLPAWRTNDSVLMLSVSIRDTYHCITEFNLSAVTVITDDNEIDQFIAAIQTNLNKTTNNSVIKILNSENLNAISQMITSIALNFNARNSENLAITLKGQVLPTDISISSLYDSNPQNFSNPNASDAITFDEFNQRSAIYANARYFLISYLRDKISLTSQSIKLQSSVLTQLTQATNQLTRNTVMIASDKCYQLAKRLNQMMMTTAYENVEVIVNQIVQCITNVLIGANGPLLRRVSVLQSDWFEANQLPSDYETDLEFFWSNPNLFANDDDFSWKTTSDNRNQYFQKQLTQRIQIQMTETFALITETLSSHTNLGQYLSINTSSVIMSYQKVIGASISNKSVQPLNNARIQFPSKLTSFQQSNDSISIRSCIQPLAIADNNQSTSNTNLSTMISLTLFDEHGHEIAFQTDTNNPIEIIIPRDPNLRLPPMIRQNVTSIEMNSTAKLFNLHAVTLTSLNNPNLNVSLHIEIQPINVTSTYLFIFKYDSKPVLSSSTNQTDGWTILCPDMLNNDGIYTYYTDNEMNFGHQSLIFGLRELNSTETKIFCRNQSHRFSPIPDRPIHFTTDYSLRTYTSGCYYLDSMDNWRSDGLLVGPKTNHYQTQCFSTHLSIFSSGYDPISSSQIENENSTGTEKNDNEEIYMVITSFFITLVLLMLINLLINGFIVTKLQYKTQRKVFNQWEF